MKTERPKSTTSLNRIESSTIFFEQWLAGICRGCFGLSFIWLPAYLYFLHILGAGEELSEFLACGTVIFSSPLFLIIFHKWIFSR